MNINTEATISLNIPITLGNVKVVCFFNNNIRSEGRDYISPPHNHGDYEIKYVVAGESRQIVNEKELTMRAGDILLIQPKTYHFDTLEGTTDSLVRYSLRFALKPPLENATAAQIKSYESLSELLSKLSLIKDDNLELMPLFEDMYTEILDKDYGFFDFLQSLCQSILIKLLRLSGIPPKNIFKSEELKYLGYGRVRLDQFIHRNYMYDIKLDDLAAALNVSRRHASRLVVKEYKKSFVEKLTQVRLEQAKYQLAYTDKELNLIGSDCGFSSHSYFTACFKKHEGVTPKQYRQKLLKVRN